MVINPIIQSVKRGTSKNKSRKTKFWKIIPSASALIPAIFTPAWPCRNTPVATKGGIPWCETLHRMPVRLMWRWKIWDLPKCNLPGIDSYYSWKKSCTCKWWEKLPTNRRSIFLSAVGRVFASQTINWLLWYSDSDHLSKEWTNTNRTESTRCAFLGRGSLPGIFYQRSASSYQLHQHRLTVELMEKDSSHESNICLDNVHAPKLTCHLEKGPFQRKIIFHQGIS